MLHLKPDSRTVCGCASLNETFILKLKTQTASAGKLCTGLKWLFFKSQAQYNSADKSVSFFFLSHPSVST